MSGKNNSKDQPSTDSSSSAFDLCNSCNFTAASPRGSLDLPFSISLTEDAVSPTSAPISPNVIPFRRKSEMRDAHVFMAQKIRYSVPDGNRHSVTEFRDNSQMPRPTGLPKFDTVGQRVRWWRVYRGFTNGKDFARMVGLKPTTLSTLEKGDQKSTTKLHRIATVLKLNPHYLETDQGEPEDSAPQQPAPVETPWPFPAISRTKIDRLDRIERSYVETKILEALAEINAERKHVKNTG